MLSTLQKHSLLLGLLALLASCRQPAQQQGQPDAAQALPDTGFLNYNQGKFFPNIAFERLGPENGLPSGYIPSLMQDRQGFLWMGTDNGLCRYDGRNFETWQNEIGDSTSLPSNQIADLAEDAQGNIWLFLIGKGICCFDPDAERFQLYGDTLHRLNQLSGRSKIDLDPKGRIWFSHGYFDIQKRAFMPVGGIEQIHHRPMALDAVGNVFCAAPEARQLWKFDESKRQFNLIDTLPKFEDDGFYRLRIDRKGNFWAGTSGGHLYKFRPGMDTVLADYKRDETIPPQYSLGGTINDFILSEKTGLIWVAQWGGLSRVDLKPGAEPKIFRYRYNEDNEYSLPDRVAACVLEDRSGVLWVGTGNGLAKFAPAKQRFQVHRKVPGDTTTLSNGNITAIFQDSKNRLWTGTRKYLNLIDQSTGKARSSPTQNTFGCNPEWISSITEDPVSHQLLLTYWGSGFNWFDPETGKFTKPTINNPKPYTDAPCWLFLTKAIFYAPDTLLLFEWGGGMYFYDQKTSIASAAAFLGKNGNKALQTGLFTCAWVDSQKNIWMGLDQEAGLFRTRFGGPDSIAWLRPPDAAPVFKQPASHQLYLPDELDSTRLASGTIATIFEDSRHRIWVGTTKGLHLLEDPATGRFRRFGKRQGFADASISGVLEDGHGLLWVSTNGGLSRFDPDSGVVKANYNFTDGLPGNQFNMSACFKDTGGKMFFGSTKGLAVFHPDSLGKNKNAPQVAITKVIADGVRIPFSRKAMTVEIPPSTNNVQIEFAALDLVRPEVNSFKYRLNGQKMSPAQSEARAIFNNLSPDAEHRFHVVAANNDRMWNEKGTYLTLWAMPEWYQRKWVQITALLSMIAGLFLFLKWREQRIIKQQQKIDLHIKSLQVQVHQAQMNPHFIFNVLMAIQGLIAQKRQEEAAACMHDFGELIRSYLDASVKSRMDMISPMQNDLYLAQEIELINMYVKFEQLACGGRFDYQLEVMEDEDLVPGDIDMPPMFIQPFVENAIKHGLLRLPLDQRGQLRVSFLLTEDKQTLRCIIEDNGVGLAEAKRLSEASLKSHESHGMHLTEDRKDILNKLGYDINIHPPRDREGGGTIVEITIAIA